jgi:hypothetical protein
MTGSSPGPCFEAEGKDEICESAYKECLEKELRYPTSNRIIIARLRARTMFGKYEAALWAEHKATQLRIAAEREFTPQWIEYYKACQDVGYCLLCDKNVGECKCAWYA